MLTKAQVATIIKNNLQDIRLFATHLYINNVIERPTYGNGIERYRIKDTVTDTFVTDYTGFVNSVNGDNIRVEYPYNGERLSGDRCTGFLVTTTNLKAVFTNKARSDDYFSNFLNYSEGGSKGHNFQFYVAYMNDGDEVLPLKISWVKIVSA